MENEKKMIFFFFKKMIFFFKKNRWKPNSILIRNHLIT